MGVRVELEDGESIAEALRRFRKQILAEGGYPVTYLGCWHKPDPRVREKPSVLRRRRRWIERVRKRGCGSVDYGWPYEWIDDLEIRPMRGWRPMGRRVTF